MSLAEREAAFSLHGERLHELRGKTLGCWCCTWSPGEPIVTPCHAIHLAQAVNAMERHS